MSDAFLIRRLQERIRTEPTVDMAVWPPIRPERPVSVAALEAAENDLGFPLPSLVRALYIEVGDGGFGPGYGLIRLAGYEGSLVERRRRMDQINAEDAAELRGLSWPERLVELVNWGCHYFSGVDCFRQSCPVFFYNHDRLVGDAKPVDCLYPESDSLADWLSAWLDGANLWKSGPLGSD